MCHDNGVAYGAMRQQRRLMSANLNPMSADFVLKILAAQVLLNNRLAADVRSPVSYATSLIVHVARNAAQLLNLGAPNTLQQIAAANHDFAQSRQ